MQNNISYPEQGAEFGDEEEEEDDAATAMERVNEVLPAGELSSTASPSARSLSSPHTSRPGFCNCLRAWLT